MEDLPQSPRPAPALASAYYSVLGLSKTASIPDIAKAYKSLVKQLNPDKNTSNKDKAEAEAKIKTIQEAYVALSNKKKEANATSKKKKAAAKDLNVEIPKTPKKYFADDEELHISSPTLVSSTSNRVTPMSTPTTDFSRSSSRSVTPTRFSPDLFGNSSSEGTTPTTPTTPEAAAPSKVASRRHSNPIIFSQSTATPRRKPPPIEKKLDCTLEELCYGGVKKIKITRDAITHFGVIVQEEEVLTIKVKPGWKKGTKITFEGKGDERPGFLPADIIFVIDEKWHPLYKREGDDLDLGVEVPLVQALTGCTITVPLLGGDTMTASFDDDVLYPGCEKIIPGQGMPKSKKGGRKGGRGDLRLKFLVEFPTDLTDEQRSEIVNILEEEDEVEEEREKDGKERGGEEEEECS